MNREKLCENFMEGECSRGKTCKFTHDSKACKFFFFDGQCKDKQCDYSHVEKHRKFDQRNDDGRRNQNNKNNDQRKNNNNNNNRNNNNNNNNVNVKNLKKDYYNYRTKEELNKNQFKNSDEYSKPVNGNKNNIKVNTQNFNPDYTPADMKVRTKLYTKKNSTYNKPIESREVIVVPNLFGDDVDDWNIYHKLLDEIENADTQGDAWKLWHGDNHLIRDDKSNWKKTCPTFNMVIDTLQKYFNIDIKATRLNWYRDSSEWKPLHHDAAAVKPDKAKTQNLTVGVSFGGERDLLFEHAETQLLATFPQPNGSVFAFAKDVNIQWRHGVPQIPPEKRNTDGRISIIAWGWVKNMEDI